MVPKPRSVGRCYRKLKKYDKSEEQLLDVLKEDPFHPQTHYELGRLYHDMKNTKKAKGHMKIAVEIWKDADSEYDISNQAKDIYKDWK